MLKEGVGFSLENCITKSAYSQVRSSTCNRINEVDVICIILDRHSSKTHCSDCPCKESGCVPMMIAQISRTSMKKFKKWYYVLLELRVVL